MHNKKYLFFITTGLLLVICASLLYVIGNKITDYSDSKTIKIDTSNMSGDEIEELDLEYYKIDNDNESYINDDDIETKNKYIFSLGTSFEKIMELDSYSKIFTKYDEIIKSYIIRDSSVSELMDDTIEQYVESGFSKIRTYKSKEDILISNVPTSYFKINALNTNISSESGMVNNYYCEEFVLYLKEDNNKIIVISYKIINKKFTDELLTELVDKIKIEYGKATYLRSQIKDNEIVGTLTAIEPITDKKYSISYKLPHDNYQEIESPKSNASKVLFSANQDKSSINMEMVTTNIENGLTQYTDRIKRQYDYAGSITKVEKIENDLVTYNDIEYIRVMMEYNNIENNEKHNYISLIYKIEDYMYYVITIDSNKEILDEDIEELLNFEIVK